MSARVLLGLATLALASACEPCAGTIACTGAPEISYTGQAIHHSDGRGVGGVRFEFVRRAGATLPNDTIRAISGSDGFFDLRAGSYDDGTVTGDLTIDPPPPNASYTVPGVRLSTSRVRGDGGILGRLVVDPYLLIVGLVRARKTEAPIANARVVMRRVGGARMTPDTAVFSTDGAGSFFLQPEVSEFGIIDADFEISAPGYPRTYVVREHMQTSYVDGQYRFVFLHAGRALVYNALVLRRGTWEAMPGTTVEFTRTGGIAVSPDHFFPEVNQFGGFPLQPEPLDDGEVVFDLTVRPPLPFPDETTRDLRLRTHDGDSLRFVGRFGYGAEAHLRAQLTDRATGAPLDSGIMTAVRRAAGVAIATPLARDSGLRETKTGGWLSYEGATDVAGSVTFDVEVRLRAPAQVEVLRGLTIPARYDSLPNDVGPLRVGLWFPSMGIVVDDLTGSPVPSARIEFRRTGGTQVSPATFVTQSESDGSFRLQPVPQQSGETVGDLFLTAGSPFRDTTITGVRLRTSQDDTVRTIGVFRLKRGP